jgi:VWFA-related protein
MRRLCKPAPVVAVLVLPWASSPVSNQDQPAVTRVAATGVLIDATVVDRKGQPILDLRPDEFELSEDGKRQQIVSVTLVSQGLARTLGGSTPDAGAASTPLPSSVSEPSVRAPVGEPRPIVTAILFDRLTTESRALAQRAALAYIATLSAEHEHAGVFVSDTSFSMLQPFTNKRDALQQATVALSARPTIEKDRAGSARVQQMPLDPSRPPTAGAEYGSGWVNVREREALLNVPGPEGALRRLELRMWEGFQQFVAELEGQVSIAGLRATVDALGLVPGRKSVLYFAENLPVTSRLKPAVEAVIGQANRHNITIYPIDAAGLRVHSQGAQVGRQVEVAGAQGIGDVKRPDGPMTKELEHQEQILTSQSSAILGRLAKETGGFLLEHTNDLAAGVARMQHDRTTYYLVAYNPSNTTADKKFRRVSVKVKRSGVTVRARPGYVMVP